MAYGVTDMSRSRPGMSFGLATEKRFESGLMIFGKFNSSSFGGSSPEVYIPEQHQPWAMPAETRKNYRTDVAVQDMSLNFGFNISKLHSFRPKLSAVISAGIGLAHFKSKATYNSAESTQIPVNSFYSGNTMIMPITLDLHYRITDRLKLGIAGSYNLTPTDNMDQVAPIIDYSRDNFGTVGLVLKYKVL